jgi:tetratricopeptide (TPR) repeat protein
MSTSRPSLPPTRSTVVTLTVIAAACFLAACGGARTTSTQTKPAPFAVLIGAGNRLFQKGNIGAAEQLFAQAVAARPNSPVAHYDLGTAYEHEGKTRLASRQYIRAIAESPLYVPALYNEAGILATHNTPLAIFYYRRVIRLRPSSADALLKLGLLEYPIKELRARALRDLARAVQLKPSLRAELPASVRARLPHGSGG